MDNDFDNNDDQNDINEYQTDEGDDDDWSDYEDEKVQILSKKQKQILAFKKLIRLAVRHFNNNEYLNFQQDLKQINDSIKKYKWNRSGKPMPKFFVKYISEIYSSILILDPSTEKNKKEQKALTKLKKHTDQQFECIKQLKLYLKNSSFWDNDKDSDIGDDDDDDDMNAYDDNVISDDDDYLGIQDANQYDNDGDVNQDGDGDNDNDGDGVDDVDDADFDDWGDDDFNDQDDDNDPNDNITNIDDDDDGDNDQYDNNQQPPQITKSSYGADVFDQEELALMRNRSFWVKEGYNDQQGSDEDDPNYDYYQKKKDDKKGKSRKGKRNKPKPVQSTPADVKSPVPVPVPGPVPVPVTPKDILRGKGSKKKRDKNKWSVTKIRDIFSDVLVNRGKSAVNRESIVSRLEELKEQCGLHRADQARLTVMSVLISFYFDTAQRKTSGMSGSRWKQTLNLISSLTRSLRKNINKIRMSNDADIRLILKDDIDVTDKDKDDNLAWMQALDDIDKVDKVDGVDNDKVKDDASSTTSASVIKSKSKSKSKKSNIKAIGVININSNKKKLDPSYQWIHGNLLSYIKFLTTQLWTNLKSLTPKSDIYQKRLSQTKYLVKLYEKAFEYFALLNKAKIQSDIQVLWMSVIHNDYHPELDELNKNGGTPTPTPIDKIVSPPPTLSTKYKGKEVLHLPHNSEIVTRAVFVFKHGTPRMQTEAMLYLIYNMSIHNRYSLCRDLLLMSHLGSDKRIGSSSIFLQILYNRTLASYAICSFCHGQWKSCEIILREIFSSSRLKILLAQGYTKAPSDNPTADQIKFEQIEQSRMLASHFHIPNDTLEAANLLSSLFIEISSMINNSYNKSYIRNPYFRKLWNSYLRRDLRVPPENTQTLILTTGIHMLNGKWKMCKNLINQLKIFTSKDKDKDSNKHIKHVKYVKKLVLASIKRECLRCYLYKYGSVYKTISINILSSMFNLSEQSTKQFICKLIITSGKNNNNRFASIDELTNCLIIHQSPPMPIQRSALEYSNKLSYLIEQNEKLLNIRVYGGRGGTTGANKYKKDGKNNSNRFGKNDDIKDDENDGKSNDKDRKNKKRIRFSQRGQRGGAGDNMNRKRGNNQQSFGHRQAQRTQLRPSIRRKT